MTKSQLVFALIVTIICVLGILAQQIWKGTIINKTTIFLLVLGILPWFLHLFKKFKIPGIDQESPKDSEIKS